MLKTVAPRLAIMRSKSSIRVKVSAANVHGVVASLLSLDGRVVVRASGRMRMGVGECVISLPWTNQVPGTYLVMVKMDGDVLSRQITVSGN
jgi:hypothetical protein